MDQRAQQRARLTLEALELSTQAKLSRARWGYAAKVTKFGLTAVVMTLPPSWAAASLGFTGVAATGAMAVAYGSVQTVLITFFQNKAAGSAAERKANLLHNLGTHCVTAVLAAGTNEYLGAIEGTAEGLLDAATRQAGAYAFGSGVITSYRQFHSMETTDEVEAKLSAAASADDADDEARRRKFDEKQTFLRDALRGGADPLQAAQLWHAHEHPSWGVRVLRGTGVVTVGLLTFPFTVAKMLWRIPFVGPSLLVGSMAGVSVIFHLDYVMPAMVKHGMDYVTRNYAFLLKDAFVDFSRWVGPAMASTCLKFITSGPGKALTTFLVTWLLRRIDLLNRVQAALANKAGSTAKSALQKLGLRDEIAHIVAHGVVGGGIQAYIASTQHRLVGISVSATVDTLYPALDGEGNPVYDPKSLGALLQKGADASRGAAASAGHAATVPFVALQAAFTGNPQGDQGHIQAAYNSVMYALSTNKQWFNAMAGRDLNAGFPEGFDVDAAQRLYSQDVPEFGGAGGIPVSWDDAPSAEQALSDLHSNMDAMTDLYDGAIEDSAGFLEGYEAGGAALEEMTRAMTDYMRHAHGIVDAENPALAVIAEDGARGLAAAHAELTRASNELSTVLAEAASTKDANALEASVNAAALGARDYVESLEWGDVVADRGLVDDNVLETMAKDASARGWGAARVAREAGFSSYKAGIVGRRAADDAVRQSAEALLASHRDEAAASAYAAVRDAAGGAATQQGMDVALGRASSAGRLDADKLLRDKMNEVLPDLRDKATSTLDAFVRESGAGAVGAERTGADVVAAASLHAEVAHEIHAEAQSELDVARAAAQDAAAELVRTEAEAETRGTRPALSAAVRAAATAKQEAIAALRDAADQERQAAVAVESARILEGEASVLHPTAPEGDAEEGPAMPEAVRGEEPILPAVTAMDRARPMSEQGMSPAEVARMVQRATTKQELAALAEKTGSITSEAEREALKQTLVQRLKLSERAADRLSRGVKPVDEMTPEDVDDLEEFDSGARGAIGSHAHGCTADDPSCWHRSVGNRMFEVTAAAAPVAAGGIPLVVGGGVTAGVALFCPVCAVAFGPGIMATAATAAKYSFATASVAAGVTGEYMSVAHSASGEVGGFFNLNVALNRAMLEPDKVFDSALQFYRADGLFDRTLAGVRAVHDMPGLSDILRGEDVGFVEHFGDASEWERRLADRGSV